jgi:hypothetical protein
MNSPHGESSVILIDSTIFITLKGAFNEFGVHVWVDKLKTIVNQLKGEPFSILTNYLEADGATPEAFRLANEYNLWLCDQNLVAKAIVTSSILAEIDFAQIDEGNRKHQNYQYFQTVDSATKWLNTQKSCIDKSNDITV